MKIIFLGDSITVGGGASSIENGFVSLVGTMLNCTVNNYGVSGTRIAKQINPVPESPYEENFYTRALRMDKDADFVFVFGGTNDYGHGDAPIGCLDNEDDYNFCGAFKHLLFYLMKTYGKDKLTYIIPLPRYNQDNLYGEGNKKIEGQPLEKYIEIEKIILQENGIKYLSFENIFPVPKVNTGDEFTIDGLHPNDNGHRIIAEEIVKYIQSRS